MQWPESQYKQESDSGDYGMKEKALQHKRKEDEEGKAGEPNLQGKQTTVRSSWEKMCKP